MGIEELLLPFREQILKIATKYGAYNLRVFGSVARGEATPDSDIDFLVELKPQSSLFDYIGLMQDLAALLGRKVVSPQYIGERVIQAPMTNQKN